MTQPVPTRVAADQADADLAPLGTACRSVINSTFAAWATAARDKLAGAYEQREQWRARAEAAEGTLAEISAGLARFEAQYGGAGADLFRVAADLIAQVRLTMDTEGRH